MKLICFFSSLLALHVLEVSASGSSTTSSHPITILQTLPDELLFEIAKKLTNINDVYALNCSFVSPLLLSYSYSSRQVFRLCGLTTAQLLFDDEEYCLTPHSRLYWSPACIYALHEFLPITSAFKFKRTEAYIHISDSSEANVESIRMLKGLKSLPSMLNVDIHIFLSLVSYSLIPIDSFDFPIAKLVDYNSKFISHVRNLPRIAHYQTGECDMAALSGVNATLTCHTILHDPYQRSYPSQIMLDLTDDAHYDEETLDMFSKMHLMIDQDFDDLVVSGIERIAPRVKALTVEYIDAELIAFPAIEMMSLDTVTLKFEEGEAGCGIISIDYFNATRVSIFLSPHNLLLSTLLNIAQSVHSGAIQGRAVQVEIVFDMTVLAELSLRRVADILGILRNVRGVTVNRFEVDRVIHAIRTATPNTLDE